MTAADIWDTVVVGGSLAGMAAAARLAKNRHRVLLLEATDRLGGRLKPFPLHDTAADPAAPLADGFPGMITFPAPWRDLFRKSGRTFDDELARSNQALVPAPAPRHVFAEPADGVSELVLPTERGVQFAIMSQHYGAAVAERWRDLLDHLDEVAQALRPLGGESELVSYRQIQQRKHILQPRRTVADLAAAIDHPHLAALIRATAWRIGSRPERTPSWCAAQLSDERRFGRWMLTTDGRPDRTSVLLDRLADRLRTRRVTITTDTTVTGLRRHGEQWTITTDNNSNDRHQARTVILAVEPGEAYRLLGKATKAERRAAARTTPASAPSIDWDVTAEDDSEPTETIVHTGTGPIITWTRSLGDGRTLVSRHDWTRAQRSAAAGIAWHGPRTALRRPPIRSEAPGIALAGPHSRGGADLSHIVLSGALASYACHEWLTSA